MPSVILSANKAIGQTLIATANVPYYYPIGNKKGVIQKGQTIGVIYSYAYGGTPDLYWMIDKGSGGFIFVKNDMNAMALTNGAAILQQIKEEQDKAEYEQKGALRYYLDKYLPVIVGGAVVVLVAPTVFGFLSSKQANKK